MNAETIAAIQAARLEFQGLLGKPFTFADSPSMNSPAAAEAEAEAALDDAVDQLAAAAAKQTPAKPAGSSQTPAAAAKRPATRRPSRPRVSPDESGQQGSWDGF